MTIDRNWYRYINLKGTHLVFVYSYYNSLNNSGGPKSVG